MPLLRALLAMLKSLIDWQVTAFLSDAQSAVMIFMIMDLLMFYLLVTTGMSRKPSKMEGLLIVVAALVIGYVASDAYLAALR